MLIPAVILGALGGVAVYKSYKDKRGVLTPERKTLYERLMVSMPDPEKLREMAAKYKEYGLNYEADMLEKRAQLREAPPEVKQQRREIIQKALESTDKDAIASVADAFGKIGAVGAEQRLREYLAGLS